MNEKNQTRKENGKKYSDMPIVEVIGSKNGIFLVCFVFCNSKFLRLFTEIISIIEKLT